MRSKLIFLLLLGLAFAEPGTALEPAAIVQRMMDTMRGDSSYTEMTMRIVRPRYTREISLRAWEKEQKHTMLFITAPARDRGTIYLMSDKDIWVYDPRIDRTTRLPSSMMAQSWMGSDFSNDDLVRDTDPVRDFAHRLLRREVYQQRECYVIEMIPKPDTPIVWGKVLLWVTTDDFLQLRVENYDQRGSLVNSMAFDLIISTGQRRIPSRVTVTPAGKEHEHTVLTYQTIEFDIPIEDDFFTKATMQRLR